jgi:hypothetical protein
MNEHPITPPLSLMQQWEEEWECFTHVENIPTGSNRLAYIATRAAQWGADEELEACCEWLDGVGDLALQLRDARRPKPPGLKEQALDTLKDLSNGIETGDSWALIQSALEQLDD